MLKVFICLCVCVCEFVFFFKWVFWGIVEVCRSICLFLCVRLLVCDFCGFMYMIIDKSVCILLFWACALFVFIPACSINKPIIC